MRSLALVFAVAAVAAQPRSVVRIRPSDVKWQSIPGMPPGYQRAMLEGQVEAHGPFTYRVHVPANFRANPHTHPCDEHVTVLKGTFYVGFGKSFDETHLEAFETGSFIVIPAGVPHYVTTRDETVFQVHGIGPSSVTFINDQSMKP